MARDYNYYLDKAKKVQGFKYDNQIDSALGFKGAIACRLRQNKAHISEESMIRLAELAGENTLMAILDLNTMRSDGTVKLAYEKIMSGLSKTIHLLTVVIFFLTFSSGVSKASKRRNSYREPLVQLPGPYCFA